MADISDGNCLNDPNFAVICSFLDRYGESLGIPIISYEDLQTWLEDTKHVPDVLTELHIRLLRRIGKSSVNFERWERYIVKFCHQFSDVDAWEVERFGYKHSKTSTKLKILKNLLECQFDSNAKFKEKINDMSPESHRIQPIGRDKHGLAYWYQLDQDLNLRVYREDQDDVDAETWQLVCRDRDELASLIGTLETDIGLKKEENDTGDSNSGSLSSNIKEEPPDRLGLKLETSSVDSPLVKDESSTDINGFGNCTSSIKIKLERVDSENGLMVKQECEAETPVSDLKNGVVKSEESVTKIETVSPKVDEDKSTDEQSTENIKIESVCETGDEIKSEDKTKSPSSGDREVECTAATESSSVGAGGKIDSVENASIVTDLTNKEVKDCEKDAGKSSKVTENGDEKIETVSEPKVEEKDNTELDGKEDKLSEEVLTPTVDKNTDSQGNEKDKLNDKSHKLDENADNKNVTTGKVHKTEKISQSPSEKSSDKDESHEDVTDGVTPSDKESKSTVLCAEDSPNDQSCKKEPSSVKSSGKETSVEKPDGETELSPDTKDHSVTKKSGDETQCDDESEQSSKNDSSQNQQDHKNTPAGDSNGEDNASEKSSKKESNEDNVSVKKCAKKPCVDNSGDKIQSVDEKCAKDTDSNERDSDLSPGRSIDKKCPQEDSSAKSKLIEGDAHSIKGKEKKIVDKNNSDGESEHVSDDNEKQNKEEMCKPCPSKLSENSPEENKTIETNSEGDSGGKSVGKENSSDIPVPCDGGGDRTVEKLDSKRTEEEVVNGEKGDNSKDVPESVQLNGEVHETKAEKVENKCETDTKLSNHIGNLELNETSSKSKDEGDSSKPTEEISEEATVGVRRSKRRRTAPVTLDMTVLEKSVRAQSKDSKSKNKQELNKVTPGNDSQENLVNGETKEKEKPVSKKKQEVKGKGKKGSGRKRVIHEQDSSVDSPVEPEVKRSRPARSAAVRGRGKRRILELENMSSTDSEDIPLSQLNARTPPKGQRKRNKKKAGDKMPSKRDKESTPDPGEALELAKGRKSSRQVKKKKFDSDDDFLPKNAKGRGRKKGRGRGRKQRSSTEEESESDDLEPESDSEDGYSPGRNNIRKKKSPSPCLPEKLEATGLGSGDEVSDDDYVPDTSVKGRNALRQEALSKHKDLEEDVHMDDTPCCKCLKYEHPEWILLCDKCDAGYHTACLRPPLMIIPDGDWFCPPCEHVELVLRLANNLRDLDVAWKKKERLNKRKERLAFVGISLGNILKQEKKEEHIEYYNEELHVPISNSHGNLARSCRSRSSVSYQFKEYDDLIESAISGDVKEELPPGRSKGKDMSNILGVSDEDERPPPVVCRKRKNRKLTTLEDYTDEESEEYNASEDTASEATGCQPGPRSRGRAHGGGGRWSRYDNDFVIASDLDSDSSGPRRKTRTASKKRVNYQELMSDSDEESLEETEESVSDFSDIASDGSVASRKASSKKEKKKKDKDKRKKKKKKRFVFKSDSEDESETEVKKAKKRNSDGEDSATEVEEDAEDASDTEESRSDDSGPSRWSRRSAAKKINFKEMLQSDSDESFTEKTKRKKKEQELEEKERLRKEKFIVRVNSTRSKRRTIVSSDSEESSAGSEIAKKKRHESSESQSESRSESESSEEEKEEKKEEKSEQVMKAVSPEKEAEAKVPVDEPVVDKPSASEVPEKDIVSDNIEKASSNNVDKTEQPKSETVSEVPKTVPEEKTLPTRPPNAIAFQNRQKFMQEKRQKLREARRQRMLQEMKQAGMENENVESSDRKTAPLPRQPNGQSDYKGSKSQGVPHPKMSNHTSPSKCPIPPQGDNYYHQPSQYSAMSSSYPPAGRGFSGPSGPPGPGFPQYQGPHTSQQRNVQGQGIYPNPGSSQGAPAGQGGFMIDNLLKAPRPISAYLDPDNDDSMSDISDIVNYVTQDEFFKEHIHK
ncbi:hypothetical protein ScPMuIL_017676 [Solemya velum]